MMMDDDVFFDLLIPAFFALFSILLLVLKRRAQRPLQPAAEDGVPPPEIPVAN